MIRIPVYKDYDTSIDPIGELRIKENALPPTPDFEFSIGYRIIDEDKYELIMVSLNFTKHEPSKI